MTADRWKYLPDQRVIIGWIYRGWLDETAPVDHLLDQVTAPTPIIIINHEHNLPEDPINIVAKSLAHPIVRHPNAGTIYLVQPPGYVYYLLGLAYRIQPTVEARVVIVDSLQEAYDMLHAPG